MIIIRSCSSSRPPSSKPRFRILISINLTRSTNNRRSRSSQCRRCRASNHSNSAQSRSPLRPHLHLRALPGRMRHCSSFRARPTTQRCAPLEPLTLDVRAPLPLPGLNFTSRTDGALWRGFGHASRLQAAAVVAAQLRHDGRHRVNALRDSVNLCVSEFVRTVANACELLVRIV